MLDNLDFLKYVLIVLSLIIIFEISKLLTNQTPVILYYKEIEPKIYNNRNYNPD